MDRHVGAFDAFADAGEEDQYQREADGAAGTEEQRINEVVVVRNVEQRHAEHGAVGGDQRQVDAQRLLQRRRGLGDDHFGQLDDGRDGDDEGQRAQVLQAKRHQQVVIDDVAGPGRHGQHEGRGGTHAVGGFQFLGNAHEGAKTENLHQHDVVDQHRTDEDEEIVAHDLGWREARIIEFCCGANNCAPLMALSVFLAQHDSEGLCHLADQIRAAVDETAIELHQRGAGLDLLGRILAAHDAADADDRQFAGQGRGQLLQHCGRFLEDRSAGQPAGFGGIGHALDAFARQRGVGGDDRIEAMAAQRVGDGGDLLVVEVGGDLQRHRHVLSVLVGQLQLARLEL
ncbi:hypothetical protein SDC9_110858 [bioreactor metagenome]|uniref:Uncharacterized protein n=1 Tax=bioreactor metagenome TaxID=1076179 RepID=A0A645BL65_9ZZZZ